MDPVVKDLLQHGFSFWVESDILIGYGNPFLLENE